MANNKLSLYRKIDDKYKTAAGIKAGLPRLSFDDPEKGKVNLQGISEESPVIEIGDGDWSPAENDLCYEQSFRIERPSELFGTEKITDSANKIGLAAHIYSKTSFFQKTVAVPVGIVNEEKEARIDFRHVFAPGSLRGDVHIDFFLYLKEINVSHDFQADRIGINLCRDNLYNASIVIDGDGAMFPIVEYSDPAGPLWTIEKDWQDPSTDEFDTTNVRIKINTANSLAKQVMQSSGRMANEIMSSIVVQSMAMIIYETVLDMKRSYGELDTDEAYDGSILQTVSDWIREYDIDTSNIMTIFDSLQNSDLQEKMKS